MLIAFEYLFCVRVLVLPHCFYSSMRLTIIKPWMQILASSSAIIRKNDDQNTAIEPNFYFIYTWSAFDLYSRLSDMHPQQIQLVKNFAISKCCNPNHLLQIALEASQGPRSNHEVATFALNTCLTALLASPSPDYRTAALILRKLISIGTIYEGDSDDNSIMEMYKQAYRIMVGLKEGEYPIEEAKWLATTAWNRAALPIKMGQFESAKKWMSIALDVVMKVPGLHMYRSCMEDYAAGFKKQVNGQDNNESRTIAV